MFEALFTLWMKQFFQRNNTIKIVQFCDFLDVID